MEKKQIRAIEEDGQDSSYKADFLNSVFCLAGIVAFGMGFIRWQQSALMGMIDFGFSGICFVLLYCLRHRKGRVELISSVALLFSFTLFFAIYLLAPYNTTRISLFFLLSVSALFLKGRKTGAIWLIFILVAIVAGHLLPAFDTAYSDVDILTTCLYLLALYVIFNNYGAIKEAQQELLEQHRARLETDVAERTAELRDANRLLEKDIGERKQAEEALRKSEERLNTAQRIARIGSWELDIVNNVLTWSNEIYRMFEIDRTEFDASYEAFLEVIHPDDRDAVNAAYAASLANRAPYSIEHRLLFPDGRIKQVCEQCETFYDADGKPLRSIGTVQDITEQKKMGDALRLARDEWERTFDAIEDPIMILDTEYRIVKTNRSMAAALSVTPAEAVGMTCYKAVHDKDLPTELCPHAMLMIDGQPHTQAIHEPRLGGHFLVSVFPLHAPDGTLTGSIHTARDITQMKKTAELNEKYSFDLERLLAVSRDITTTTDLKSLYRTFVSTARDVLALDCSTLMLLSEDKNTLTMVETLGFPASIIGTFSLVEGQGLSPLVVRSKKPETVTDWTSETRFEVPSIVREQNLLSAVAVPMLMKDEIIGVLIGHTIDRREFSTKDISLYQQIANQAAVAIQNARNTDSLRKNEKMIRDITSTVGEGLYSLNGQGMVTFMNPEAERLLGWSEEELRGKNIHDLVHNRKPDGSPLLFNECPMHNVTNTGERYVSHDEMFTRKDGASFPVSVISAPVIENSKVIAAVTSFRDITDLKEAQNALNRANRLLELQATTDSLTGIFNRFRFDEVLVTELSRSRRYNIPLSLVMFDLDYFKHINDTFGHHTGDVALKELTAHIAKTLRKHDYFARWGGDEFMVLLTHTTIEPAANFAENIRVETERLKIGVLEGLTCSFGVTELKADDDIFSFTKRVDEALYRAKSRGRNRVETV